MVKRACLAAGVLAAAATAGQPPAPATSFPAAELSDLDLAFLARSARRVAVAAWNGRTYAAADYRPAAIASLRHRVAVTLRLRGRDIGFAASGDAPLLDAVMTAAADAARRIPATFPASPANVLRLGVELEILGPERPLSEPFDDELRFRSDFYRLLEPGVDGVAVELGRRRGLCLPGTIVASNYSPLLALQHAEKQAGFTADTKAREAANIRYSAFRTVHVWLADADAKAVRLWRGLRLIPTESITAEALDGAASDAAAHVMRRRRRDAWFAYEYLPTLEQYGEGNSLFGQFAAAWGLSRYGRIVARRDCIESAGRVIAAAQSFVQPFLPNVPARAVIPTSEAAPLATTSIYLAARVTIPWHEIHVEPAPLADAIRLVQNADGRFDVTFPPSPVVEGHADAAAVAVLGLLEYAGERPDADVDRAVRQAVRFYSRYFQHLPDRVFAAWLAQAMAAAYRRTTDPRASDLLFAAADWLADQQVPPARAAIPDLAGGIVDRDGSPPDAASVVALLGLCDGLEIARRVGDAPRAARYERAALLAARFVMQLQFRREECFYLGAADDVHGGVRSAPWNNHLLIENTALAACALARTRTLLFGPPAPPASSPAAEPASTQPRASARPGVPRAGNADEPRARAQAAAGPSRGGTQLLVERMDH